MIETDSPSKILKFQASRRTVLKTATLGFVTLMFAACNKKTGEKSELKDPAKAERIRGEIRELEEANWDNLSVETTAKLARLIPELYQATFGRKSIENQFFFVDNSFFTSQGLPGEEAPLGHAGFIKFYDETQVDDPSTIPIIILVGKPEIKDPNLNKLSVVRGLLIHEYIHAQTVPVVENGEIIVGGERFRALYRRGLKWEYLNGNEEEGKGRFFEEINTQLLSEYLNDPTEKDQLFNQIVQNPVYRFSLAPNYVAGAAILAKIYQKLGITPEEIEGFHFKAQPKEFLEKIDKLIQKQGIKLEKPASLILLNLNPPNPQTEEGLEPLKELASKI